MGHIAYLIMNNNGQNEINITESEQCRIKDPAVLSFLISLQIVLYQTYFFVTGFFIVISHIEQ